MADAKADFYQNARTDLSGPLDGVRVIDCTTAWAGPMAGCLLADFGADVVRVAMPGDPGIIWPPLIPGTGQSFASETVNRNKRSVSIDLRTADGAEVFLELVKSADIVVENFKPGTLAKWGVGYAECRAVKDDVVYLSVSGYGQFGPKSPQPGYDPAALAFSGWMALNGSVDGPPTKAPTFLADDLAGLHGALAALAALRHRDHTGEGQHVDVSLLDSIIYQSNGLLTLGATGVKSPRWGSQIAVSVPTNNYQCTDGYVYIALILDGHWRKLANQLGHPELAEAPGYATNNERIENRDAVDGLVAEWCSSRSSAEVLAAMDEAGIVASPVNDFATAATDPHVLERDMLQVTELRDGTSAPLVGPAAKFSRTPTKVRSPAPASNQHTDEVLTALGMSAERLAELRGVGAID
ncbi:MAG: formyl-CoA transferase [Acidimicrobiales bacterium]|jgi:formyl-CoA transferase